VIRVLSHRSQANLVALDAGDLLRDAFAISCPDIDAKGKVSFRFLSRQHHRHLPRPQSSSASRFTALL
jgi:hypothetical protein